MSDGIDSLRETAGRRGRVGPAGTPGQSTRPQTHGSVAAGAQHDQNTTGVQHSHVGPPTSTAGVGAGARTGCDDTVQPLDESQIEAFAGQWHNANNRPQSVHGSGVAPPAAGGIAASERQTHRQHEHRQPPQQWHDDNNRPQSVYDSGGPTLTAEEIAAYQRNLDGQHERLRPRLHGGQAGTHQRHPSPPRPSSSSSRGHITNAPTMHQVPPGTGHHMTAPHRTRQHAVASGPQQPPTGRFTADDFAHAHTDDDGQANVELVTRAFGLDRRHSEGSSRGAPYGRTENGDPLPQEPAPPYSLNHPLMASALPPWMVPDHALHGLENPSQGVTPIDRRRFQRWPSVRPNPRIDTTLTSATALPQWRQPDPELERLHEYVPTPTSPHVADSLNRQVDRTGTRRSHRSDRTGLQRSNSLSRSFRSIRHSRVVSPSEPTGRHHEFRDHGSRPVSPLSFEPSIAGATSSTHGSQHRDHSRQVSPHAQPGTRGSSTHSTHNLSTGSEAAQASMSHSLERRETARSSDPDAAARRDLAYAAAMHRQNVGDVQQAPDYNIHTTLARLGGTSRPVQHPGTRGRSRSPIAGRSSAQATQRQGSLPRSRSHSTHANVATMMPEDTPDQASLNETAATEDNTAGPSTLQRFIATKSPRARRYTPQNQRQP